jgi:hypothetical protein
MRRTNSVSNPGALMSTRIRCSVLIVLALAVSASLAEAQTRASNDPFVNSEERAGYDGTRSIDYSMEYVRDYPATEVRAVPAARARKTQSRLEYERARSSLYTALDWLREDFEYSDEVVEARSAERDAHDRYVQARDRVLRDLYENNTEYRALIDLRDELSQQTEALNSQHLVNQEQVIAVAIAKLRYAMQARQIETDALAQDSDLEQARQRLRDAGTRFATMRQRFDRQIRRDGDFLSAKRNMDDSRIAYITSDAYLQSAVTARNIALDYAYELRRFDKYKHLTTYSPHTRYTYGDYGYIYRY